jgi:hypothetical protein
MAQQQQDQKQTQKDQIRGNGKSKKDDPAQEKKPSTSIESDDVNDAFDDEDTDTGSRPAN